jgi:ABC-type phosphate transport system permease subunit
MKLSIWPFTLAAAILWGAVVLVCGIANLIWPSYAEAFLQWCASVYPGYKAETNIGQVIVGTLYALLDGAVFGFVLALLYNAFVPSAKKGESAPS